MSGGSFLVACLRHKALEHLTFMVNGPPKIMLLTIDLHNDLIQMPAPAARSHPRDAPFSDFRSKERTEPVPPKPHRFVADLDAALVQEFLHVAQRQWKTDVHHDGQADDFWAGLKVAKGAAFCHPLRLSDRLSPLKNFVLTVPPAQMNLFEGMLQ